MPDPAEFRARLDAWRSLPPERQAAHFARPPLGPSPDGRVRAGLIAPCLQMGGAEAWQLALARHVDPAAVAWVGCCVAPERPGPEFPHDPAMLSRTRGLMPVSAGTVAARDLAERCDVLVTWAITGIANLLGGMARRPAVVSVCHAPAESPWGQKVYAGASGIDRWVAVSELALRAIPEATRASVPTSVISNCVDTSRMVVTRPRAEMRRAWGVPEGSRIAGYLGRLSHEKDPHAMRRLVGHLPEDWHAVVVGAGFETLETHPRLRLVGPDPAAGNVLNAFDVLVVPSHYESFGLTIAEGLWRGMPVVATPSGVVLMNPGLVDYVPVGAEGPVLARAVLRSYQRGPMPGSKDWAREHLGPARFGHEWTDLIREAAR